VLSPWYEDGANPARVDLRAPSSLYKAKLRAFWRTSDVRSRGPLKLSNGEEEDGATNPISLLVQISSLVGTLLQQWAFYDASSSSLPRLLDYTDVVGCNGSLWWSHELIIGPHDRPPIAKSGSCAPAGLVHFVVPCFHWNVSPLCPRLLSEWPCPLFFASFFFHTIIT
jgi:hypothetical protein